MQTNRLNEDSDERMGELRVSYIETDKGDVPIWKEKPS
jgi:hypothetical protein